MWELVILYGISWAGAGGQKYETMPDKETCIQVLEVMKVQENGTLVTNGNGKQVIMYCRPKGSY